MILITGGLGYLGGLISNDLIKKGNDIKIGTSRSNPSIPEELNSCEIVKIDLENSSSLKSACRGVNTIIHLVSPNSKFCEENRQKALMVNGLGTLKLLNAAKSCLVNKFIYFSTIHIYGNFLKGNIDETVIPRPLSSYAITHRIAEDYVLSYDQANFLRGCVLRLSNVIGAPLNKNCNGWDLVINDLCLQSVRNKTIKLKSTGMQKRNFLTIEYLLQIINTLIVKSSKDSYHNLFNIGGQTISIFELAETIANCCNKLFGYLPVIEKGKQNELVSNFDYDYSRIQAIEYPLGSIENEIDRILLQCKKNFQ